ncbi:C1 family peptidase [Streptomyces sp. NPDC020096]
MSRPAHKWKSMSGTSRTVIALATAGVIGAVAVGVSSASTVLPGHDQAPSQASGTASGRTHPYGLGAVPSPKGWRESELRTSVEPKLQAIAPNATAGSAGSKKHPALPSSVDLTKYAATPGNQGQVGSCAAWAIDYSAYSILEHEQRISGGPQAPMYTFAQIVKGNGDWGSSAEANFQIASSQGIDSKSHYWQGNFDYTTQPTASEIHNAAKWKLSGYTPLHNGSQIKADVQAALAKGEPVAIGIPVYNSFFYLNAQQAASYTYSPASGEQYAGGHEMTIVGYNSKGVRVENSWGTGWGDHGFINLSWDFLAHQVWEANAVGKLIKR